jgi:hypothetical protein
VWFWFYECFSGSTFCQAFSQLLSLSVDIFLRSCSREDCPVYCVRPHLPYIELAERPLRQSVRRVVEFKSLQPVLHNPALAERWHNRRMRVEPVMVLANLPEVCQRQPLPSFSCQNAINQLSAVFIKSRGSRILPSLVRQNPSTLMVLPMRQSVARLRSGHIPRPWPVAASRIAAEPREMSSLLTTQRHDFNRLQGCMVA